ncbi:MAG: UDP-N-acetylglucosamine pyrophosphorylase [Clostridia bacterium]|nr:UDP-N-acetylglucosamine pyrophosphorylase [Clostridia bacterium]
MKSFILKDYDLTHTVISELFRKTEYPHQTLSVLSENIISLGKKLPTDIFYSPKENIWIAKSATIAESALINAPCIIDENADIRHCAYIRGSVIVGKKTVVGNSTELKNCVLFDNVQVPHYNYVGDSVLGYRAHLGAGAILSNVKGDRSSIAIDYGKEKIESNLTKLGAMIGNNVEIGCGAVLNPGTVVSNCSRIYPLSSVRGYIPENCIYKGRNEIVDINTKQLRSE